MSLVQRNWSLVILLVITVLGCMKSPGNLSHHGRSFSEGSYHGFWTSPRFACAQRSAYCDA